MSQKLTLISHKLCPYVQRAVIALTEKGVPFERIDIDLANKPDWFLKISPLGKVPVLVVAGGGARNHTMLRMLRECLQPASVEAADTLGWASDAIEAQAFGFLAARGLKGLPLSYPTTTGVSMPMTGGIVARP